MIRDGHLKRSDGHLFLAYPVDSIALENARRLWTLINKAFSELSKMGTDRFEPPCEGICKPVAAKGRMDARCTAI